MAIALRPKLLIADEPTTALDVTTQAQILELLRGWSTRTAWALMFITHDLAVVADIADRIAIMRAARWSRRRDRDGRCRELRHPYSRALFAGLDARARRAPRTRPQCAAPVLEVDERVARLSRPAASLFGPAEPFRAVDGVSFIAQTGRVSGSSASSGCGKSTLARMVLALEAEQRARSASTARR